MVKGDAHFPLYLMWYSLKFFIIGIYYFCNIYILKFFKKINDVFQKSCKNNFKIPCTVYALPYVFFFFLR